MVFLKNIRYKLSGKIQD